MVMVRPVESRGFVADGFHLHNFRHDSKNFNFELRSKPSLFGYKKGNKSVKITDPVQNRSYICQEREGESKSDRRRRGKREGRSVGQ